MRLTKIVSTIGPASNSPEILKKMIDSGMDVARLNFSHGNHQSHEQVFESIRNICDDVAVGIDISGPKIRLGNLEGKIELQSNNVVTLTSKDVVGSNEIVPVNYPTFSKEVSTGNSIFINDGLVRLEVKEIKNDDVICTVIDGGEISSRKGVNLPDANLSLRVPTPKDVKDLEKACELGTDMLFISFIRGVDDLKKINEIVESRTNKNILLIAKIEHRDPLDSIQDIIEFSDGLMVARGDLAIEVGPARVPVLQKELIKLGMIHAKPIIVATQMLESMTKEALPTRAEASDVAHAVFDGADALMLSAETATGKHPLQVLKIMQEIICEAEKNISVIVPSTAGSPVNIGKEIGISAVRLAERMSAKAILALTRTGYSASMASRNRKNIPIFAVTPNQDTKRTTRLYWGVKPFYHEFEKDYDSLVYNVIKEMNEQNYLEKTDNVVIIAGSMVGISGKTHTIQLLNVNETLSDKKK
ncbi:MAG: pyruvate kinase [Candidatus Heimdallarchaeota archaeon]|nr:pyruvate kinase [Candidatus Heimdallarchaeota archaeon]